jgi:hypothetical protein
LDPIKRTSGRASFCCAAHPSLAWLTAREITVTAVANQYCTRIPESSTTPSENLRGKLKKGKASIMLRKWRGGGVGDILREGFAVLPLEG